MNVDYIIVGQGICGTFLSYELWKRGKTILVIDEEKDFTASKVASGVINPVTGRRIVKTWMIDELLPFAKNKYEEIGNELDENFVRELSVLDLHPTIQMKESFEKRRQENDDYLFETDESQWQQYFHFNYGIGEVKPCLLIELQLLLEKWRKKLLNENILLDEKFDFSQLTIHDSRFAIHDYQLTIQYKNISAAKIIFCEGVEGFENPFFKMLPYVRTKGEALIAEIPNLPSTNIYKQGLSIVPWQDNLFWIGSSYEWNYTDANPTELFRKKTEAQLKFWLKIPFKIIDHLSSERPANVERRPFVGFHPLYKNIGILNGMGTKGCSLAPYFAKQFADNLIDEKSINPLADVSRFTKTLQR